MSALNITNRLRVEGLEDRTCPSLNLVPVDNLIPIEQFHPVGAGDRGRFWEAANATVDEVDQHHLVGITERAAGAPDTIWSGSRVWDADTGKEVAVLTGYAGPVSAASFSPDGRWVVTGSHDAGTGKEVAVLTGSGNE
ncbi:MAG TPA: hypothetical protein VKE74_16765 [Gemmataceae bacterium]|nr:hypothetical protein [Gemmataceae bacterium]